MEGVVLFGKGGIGKSTLASNLTALLAAGGRKVLHVGCDPKMDSTLALMRRHIPSFTSRTTGPGQGGLADSVFESPIPGVHCVEAGGPQPGVGCAGTGIGSMLDAMKDADLIARGGYDAAVFDVLGDVVCGGFAAPLRRGFAKKVVIVTSEEMLSLYSANRLIMMVNNYARNGVWLAGLAANVKTPAGADAVREFARHVNTRVLGVLQRDPAVTAAEKRHLPAVLAAPESDFTRRAAALCRAIVAAARPAAAPSPMADLDFFAFSEGRKAPPRRAAAPAGKPRNAASLFAELGLRPSGMEGNQIVCDWDHPALPCRIVLAPASSATEGRARFSDWAVCFHPTTPKATMETLWKDLMAAGAKLAALRHDDMLGVFTGMKNFYGKLLDQGTPENADLDAPGTPRRPNTGFGQWQRFIFPRSMVECHIPQGSLMVEHADAECRYSGCEGGVMGLFVEAAGIGAFERENTGPHLPRRESRIVNDDFNGRDSVFGDERKLLRSMRDAARRAGPGGYVEFYVGCSPMMLASDAASLAARVEKETGTTIALDHYNSFYEHSPQKAALRARFMAGRLKAAKAGPRRDAHLANWGISRHELSRLLGERGISCVADTADFYAACRSARLQVLPVPDPVLSGAFDQAGLKWLEPPAPYGFAGTRAWLAAIGRALGRKPDCAPAAAQLRLAAERKTKFAKFAAAFILQPGETGLLFGGQPMKMVPVLPVLAEAGLAVRLLVHRDSEQAEREIKRRLAELRRRLPGAKLSAALFGGPDDLKALLRADRALRLVYSDVRNDPRVAAAGKTPFSAALFEPGFAGALETQRRLLELCEWDFHERYPGT